MTHFLLFLLSVLLTSRVFLCYSYQISQPPEPGPPSEGASPAQVSPLGRVMNVDDIKKFQELEISRMRVMEEKLAPIVTLLKDLHSSSHHTVLTRFYDKGAHSSRH